MKHKFFEVDTIDGDYSYINFETIVGVIQKENTEIHTISGLVIYVPSGEYFDVMGKIEEYFMPKEED